MNSQSTYDPRKVAAIIQYIKSVRDRRILFHDWPDEHIVIETVKRLAASECFAHCDSGGFDGLAFISVLWDDRVVRIDNIVVESQAALGWLIKEWYDKFDGFKFTGKHLGRQEICYSGDKLKRILTFIYKYHGRRT